MPAKAITGFETWVDFLKALVFVCAGGWAALVFALDDRYTKQESLDAAVAALRADRMEADIRSISRRIAIVDMQAQAADDATTTWKRQQEKILLEADKADLERELEHLDQGAR